MWAVIPVKQLKMSKQRLAAVLNVTQRAALMTAMIEDVLAAMSKVHGLSGRLLVTRDERLHALAARYGAEILCEQAPALDQPTASAAAINNGHTAPRRDDNAGPENGLCRALDEAASYLLGRGARGMFIVPGDVPLIDAAEINALLTQHQLAQREHAQRDIGERGTVTIVPDRDSSGTNALLLSPPGSIGFRFGVDSCRRHEQSASAAGLRAQVVRVASLALDVDTVQDLKQLRLRGQGTHAHAVLARFDEGKRANKLSEARAALNGSAQ